MPRLPLFKLVDWQGSRVLTPLRKSHVSVITREPVTAQEAEISILSLFIFQKQTSELRKIMLNAVNHPALSLCLLPAKRMCAAKVLRVTSEAGSTVPV